MNTHIKFKEVIAHNLENEKIFKSKSLEDQIAYVTGILTMEQVLYLQFNVLDILEPRGKAYTALGYMLIWRLYDTYRRWFLETCRESKENSQKAFDLLHKKTEDFQNLLFDQPAKPSIENTT